MALSVPGHWIWDFWLANSGEEWHVFFLRAPKTLVDPDLRHINATIGHARSTDLRTWELLPDPFGLGAMGEWDDVALWTGSCVWSGEQWWMVEHRRRKDPEDRSGDVAGSDHLEQSRRESIVRR